MRIGNGTKERTIKQYSDPSQIKSQFDGAHVKKRKKQPEMAVFCCQYFY